MEPKGEHVGDMGSRYYAVQPPRRLESVDGAAERTESMPKGGFRCRERTLCSAQRVSEAIRRGSAAHGEVRHGSSRGGQIPYGANHGEQHTCPQSCCRRFQAPVLSLVSVLMGPGHPCLLRRISRQNAAARQGRRIGCHMNLPLCNHSSRGRQRGVRVLFVETRPTRS